MILKKFWGIGLLLVAVGILGCQTSPERPNILIVLADDLGYSDIGAYGGEIHTPTLDTLAENGVRFRQFYNAGRCCPTRAFLLTGRYPHGVGMGAMVSSVDSELATGPYQGYLSESALTLAEMLQDAGYHTYMYVREMACRRAPSALAPHARVRALFRFNQRCEQLLRNHRKPAS